MCRRSVVQIVRHDLPSNMCGGSDKQVYLIECFAPDRKVLLVLARINRTNIQHRRLHAYSLRFVKTCPMSKPHFALFYKSPKWPVGNVLQHPQLGLDVEYARRVREIVAFCQSRSQTMRFSCVRPNILAPSARLQTRPYRFFKS